MTWLVGPLFEVLFQEVSMMVMLEENEDPGQK